jgi:hypothetical protein
VANREYDPATLPEVDAVDVIRLEGATPGGGSVNDFIRSRATQPEIRLTGVDAERIADLWRALPPGEPARCHIPPYGLRFWIGAQLIVEASLCWQCNNAYGYLGADATSFAFDAKALSAVALLMQLRHVLPPRAA